MFYRRPIEGGWLMVRFFLIRGVLGVVLLIGGASWLALGGETPVAQDAKAGKGKAGNRPMTLAEKLETPITIAGFEPNTPLKEALEFLSDTCDFTVLIDTEAFKADGIPEVENQPVKL